MDTQVGQTMLFDKPKSWTSFDVVKKVRNTLKIKKVGHAGTLDPLATGLLILCTGKHTKTIPLIQSMEKEYLVTFKLGFTTASYDAETPEVYGGDPGNLTLSELKAAMATFEGTIEQVPPVYSAVKVEGKRAYEAARKGQPIALKTREVHIYAFEWIAGDPEPPVYQAKVICSKGTYIRSLIHDLGQKLGVGAYVTDLRRTRIGDYAVENAWKIEEFVELWKRERRE